MFEYITATSVLQIKKSTFSAMSSSYFPFWHVLYLIPKCAYLLLLFSCLGNFNNHNYLKWIPLGFCAFWFCVCAAPSVSQNCKVYFSSPTLKLQPHRPVCFPLFISCVVLSTSSVYQRISISFSECHIHIINIVCICTFVNSFLQYQMDVLWQQMFLRNICSFPRR